MRRILIVIFLSILFYSCRNREINKHIVPETGGRLRLSSLASVENLDPQNLIFSQDMQIAAHIYEGLVRFAYKSFDVEPCLAESWKILNNGHIFQFKLRDSVYFHDNPCFSESRGRLLDADDVLYSFHRLADKHTKSPHRSLFLPKIKGMQEYAEGLADSISGIKKRNDRIIEFYLNKPYTSFLKLMATPAASIIPKEAVNIYQQQFSRNPVGTGPFRLALWRPLQHIRLSKNIHYREFDNNNIRLPYLDGIEIKLLSNPAVVLSAFLSGEVDIISLGADRLNEIVLQEGRIRDFKTAQVNPSLNVRFWGFSLDAEGVLSKNASLRKAIALSLKREMQSMAEHDSTVLPNTFAPPFMTGLADKQWYNYDPDAARLLAKPFLKSDARRVELASNLDTEDLDVLKDALDIINMPYMYTHKPVEYYKYIFDTRPDLFRVSFRPALPDAEEYYHLFSSKNTGVSNITGYSNPVFDEILERAEINPDNEERAALFSELEDILKNDVSVLYFCFGFPEHHLAAHFVEGFQARHNGYHLHQTWIRREQAAR